MTLIFGASGQQPADLGGKHHLFISLWYKEKSMWIFAFLTNFVIFFEFSTEHFGFWKQKT